jgi:hypothetical protein
MSTVRGFFVGALKIATALVLAVVALALLTWGAYEFSGHRKRSAEEPFAKLKVWTPVRPKAPDMDAAFSLKTIWRDGQMSYHFAIEGYPAAIEKLRTPPWGASKEPQFHLVFLDSDGFKLFDHSVKLSEMTMLVTSTGKPSGFEAKSGKYISADMYGRAASWEMTWTSP